MVLLWESTKFSWFLSIILAVMWIQTILIYGKADAKSNRKPYLTSRDFLRGRIRQRMMEEDSINKSMSSIVEPVWDSAMLEGDIDLKGKSIESVVDKLNSSPVRQDDFDSLDNALSDKSKLWPFGLIPYRLSSEFDNNQRASIAMAIDEIERETCIQWKYAELNESDYVMLNLSQKCSSGIGRSSGMNTLLLSPPCLKEKGVVLHEMMHAVGFVHEQSRHDRDQYVEIQWSQLPNGRNSKNFLKYGMDLIDNLNTNYDYSSIMHYPRFINGMEIIVPYIDVEIGQRERLSETDIYKIRRLYECSGDKTPVEVCDLKIECVRRAKEGECFTNADEMMLECRKYCLMCSKSPRQISEVDEKACPPGWIEVTDACYKIIGIRNFVDAEEICQAEHPSSHLPVFRHVTDSRIFDEHVRHFIPIGKPLVYLAGTRAKYSNSSSIWILPDYAEDNNTYGNNSDLRIPFCRAKFLDWAPWQPDNRDGNEDCLARHRHDFTYNDVPCNLTNQNLVCQIPLFNICDCPSGWTKTPNACYKYIGVQNFTDAGEVCALEHPTSQLPVFHNSRDVELFKENVEPFIAHNNLNILIGGDWNLAITPEWTFPRYAQLSQQRELIQKYLLLYPERTREKPPSFLAIISHPTLRCPLAFLDWGVGQPDYFGTKRCLMLDRRDYKYNDVPCTTTRLNMICQIPFFTACLNIDDSNSNCCPYAFPRGCTNDVPFMQRTCSQSCGPGDDKSFRLIANFEKNNHKLPIEDHCKLNVDQSGSPGPDMLAECAKNAQEGKCKSMPFRMSQVCPKSCNITVARYPMLSCGNTDEFPVYVDEACINESIDCEYRAWNGECTSQSFAMQRDCCLACRRLDDVILKNCPK